MPPSSPTADIVDAPAIVMATNANVRLEKGKQKLGDVLGLLVKGRLPHVDVRARGGSEGNDPSPPPFRLQSRFISIFLEPGVS